MTTVKEETQQVHPFEMRVLDSNGDTRYPTDEILTTEQVKEKFDELVRGHKSLAYTVPADGSMGTAIREFDPEVSIVITPQMQGG